MEQQFDSRVACETWLRSELGSSFGEQRDAGLLGVFADACEEQEPDAAREGAPFEMRLGRWVIRDEDLKVFATVKDALLALAGAGYVFADLTVGGFTSVAFALVQLLRNAYRAGAWVSPRQARVLAVLTKARQPLGTDEILKAVAPTDPAWDDTLLRSELAALEKVATRNGVVPFVQQTAGGKWVPAGV